MRTLLDKSRNLVFSVAVTCVFFIHDWFCFKSAAVYSSAADVCMAAEPDTDSG